MSSVFQCLLFQPHCIWFLVEIFYRHNWMSRLSQNGHSTTHPPTRQQRFSFRNFQQSILCPLSLFNFLIISYPPRQALWGFSVWRNAFLVEWLNPGHIKFISDNWMELYLIPLSSLDILTFEYFLYHSYYKNFSFMLNKSFKS